LTDCTYEKKIGILPHNLAQRQPSITEVSKQDKAQCIHKRMAVVNRIWTISAVASHEIFQSRIWQNFPQKTVDPKY